MTPRQRHQARRDETVKVVACKNCGKSFEVSSRKQVLCSQDCYRQRNNEQHRVRWARDLEYRERRKKQKRRWLDIKMMDPSFMAKEAERLRRHNLGHRRENYRKMVAIVRAVEKLGLINMDDMK